MSSQPPNPSSLPARPLATDRRAHDAATGVARYARALRTAQRTIDPGALTVEAGEVAEGRLHRWIGALPPRARLARRSSEAIVAPDVFRRAQVHFDIHRRPLVLDVPGPLGIVHWSYPLPLRIAGWANVYTVHDAIPLIDPDLSPIAPARHRRLLTAVARDAAAIVTVSAAARAEIIDALDLDPARIVDCGQAVAPAPGPPPPGLTPGGYLLVVGSIEPRKNIAAILAAYRASGVSLPLVLAGPDGWRAATIAPLIAATPGIVRLAVLDDGAIESLVTHARAVLMPSLAEGFGLPVAEAMALGTPVVTSATGALAEVAGDAALLVDPRDHAALVAAIRRIAGDDRLAATLAARGRLAAARYTPARFAACLTALYAGLIVPAARSA